MKIISPNGILIEASEGTAALLVRTGGYTLYEEKPPVKKTVKRTRKTHSKTPSKTPRETTSPEE